MSQQTNDKMLKLIEAFWAEQRNSWALMQKGYTDLESVVTRDISYGGRTFRAQHNPARIASSGAKVDKKSIAERPCFLCPHTLKGGQKGILLLGKYLLLINPFPILKEHFTIPHISHVPQELSPQVMLDMAEMAQLLSGRYDVYFNGASAGASAPDHFHFQGGLQGLLPLTDQPVEEWLQEGGEARIGVVEQDPRTVLVVEAVSPEGLVAGWQRIYELVQNPQLLNLVIRHTDTSWTLWVILRGRHRPECYYKEDSEQILVSPGVIDMCGVAVLPRVKDYEVMDGATWYHLMQEVSLPKPDFENIIRKLRS